MNLRQALKVYKNSNLKHRGGTVNKAMNSLLRRPKDHRCERALNPHSEVYDLLFAVIEMRGQRD